ncbi:MAG: hypothetical protein Q9195_004027 [Heterodermia aff. obscurata]
MTFPYRIVWHSMDPTSPQAPIGQGEKTDFITIQRLSRSTRHNRNPSHIIYFQYHAWAAELYCNFNEAEEVIENFSMKQMSRGLRSWIATPVELEYGLYERLSPGWTYDREAIDELVKQGPMNVRMRREKDNDGHCFLEVNIMCKSTGSGPWVLRIAGKLWDVTKTEEEELLTNGERRRLGITDSDWAIWGGRDPESE